jgi:hypothetical protein
MTVLTMRYLRGHFVVTGPDIEPLNSSHAKDWCDDEHHQGSPIKEIAADAVNRASKGKARLSYGHGNASGQILGEALKYRLNLNIVRVPTPAT